MFDKNVSVLEKNLTKQTNFPFNEFKSRLAASAGVHFIIPDNL